MGQHDRSLSRIGLVHFFPELIFERSEEVLLGIEYVLADEKGDLIPVAVDGITTCTESTPRSVLRRRSLPRCQ